MNAVHQSSSEHDSIGSRDTGIDLNPDDVPAGYHPAFDRLSVHRRRSRSVAASRAAEAESVPRVIDADDETDSSSVVGKDAAAASCSGRRSTSRSASFDKTLEWLMTRTSSKHPPSQRLDPRDSSLSRSGSHVHDTQGFDDALTGGDAECTEMSLLAKAHEAKPDSRSQSCSPVRSVSLPVQSAGPSQCGSAATGNENRLVMSSDNLNIGVRHRRNADGSAAATEQHVANSDTADPRHHLELQASRHTPSSVDLEMEVRNRRRSKQKVLLYTLLV